ncbi:MAG TPA: menaquinol oxidoreductase [Desulfonatronum sp.]|nr:menaquinol oxidoreductase [Desulfonatronum sp.]
MAVWYSLIAVLALVLIAFLGAGVLGLQVVFGVLLPYAAILLFIVGFIYRVVDWARSPVPFRIPTTAGQQYTLPWIKSDQLDNPHNTWGVVKRMVLEILFFRSLFRNTKTELQDGKLAYGSSKWLWLAGIAFHYSFLIIVIRHLRFFTEPLPALVHHIEVVDSILQIGVPVLYQTDVLFLAAVSYLFLRRVVIPQLRYISLPADYFALFLILGIGVSGVVMRYFTKVDVMSVKVLTMGLATFRPHIPEDPIGVAFYIHLFLVCILLAYFPFSKLMHMGGVFLSPTRNLANNNRMKRHVNPWNYPVKVHKYEAYEDEFREHMVNAGLPVEKPLERKTAEQAEHKE